ncbi:hypothetical protein BGZ49_003145 [Haplosporangium sp. Z 27]|nr:hypothetical protein BGZ49_003145 [Haplosporangium sp. Z 27]
MKITTAATIVSLAVATLVSVEASSAGHSIPLVRNEKHTRNFKAAMARLAQRYPQLGLTVPHDPVRVNTASSSGSSVPVTDYGVDSEYYGVASVGSPGQSFKFIFDTGSADIWVPSTNCKSLTCQVHPTFNSTKSSTFKKDGRPWSIKYGDGSSASGILGSDFVTVGNIKLRQTIGLTTLESDLFAFSPQDGLFGLGFSSIESVAGVKTFMDNAIAAKAVAQPVFSVFLPSIRRNGGVGGSYLFGAIDKTKYSGSLTYVPVTTQGYWQVAIQNVYYNTKSLAQPTVQGIIDTGTTLTIVGNSTAAAIHKNINGAGYGGAWTVPCSVKSSNDTVSFKMAGKRFQVPVADLAWYPLDGQGKVCYSGIQGGTGSLWILGDVFVKNNYCVFNHSSTPSIGIAPLKY